MLKIFSTLIGGVGVFVFSVYLINKSMSEELLNKSDKLIKFTNTPFKALLVGLFSSALTQSSSAINGIAVQLADKNLLTKNNRYYLVMGTNVGTTITAYLAVLGYIDASTFFLILMPIAAIILAVSKNEQVVRRAFFVCSFLMIFIGINVISDSVPKIISKIDITPFTDGNKLKLLFLSTLVTAVCQSSSVISLIIVMLGHSGAVSIDNAVFLIMGANIGTCATAFLAAIGKSKKGKEVAVFNLLFNIGGVAAFSFAFATGLLNGFINLSVSTDTKIALFHTLFNVVSIIFVIPFTVEHKGKKSKIKPTSQVG